MNKRNTIVVVAAAGLAAALWIALRSGGEASGPAGAGAAAPPPGEGAPSDAPAPRAHARHAGDPAAHGEAPAPDEDEREGADEGDGEAAAVSLPPLPDRDEILARPGREEPTVEDRLATQRAALGLVDRGIERLDARRARAEAAGDEPAAQRSRTRIERLRARRAAIEAQIQALEAPEASR